MGKGGGSQQPQNSTVTQTNLPEYARPYFENLLQRTQAESYRDYTPYQGQRIPGFTPGQQMVQQEVAGMGTPSQFDTATTMTTDAAMQSTGYGGLGSGLGLGAVGAGQQAVGFGQQAANVGQMGLGYGQQGAGLGQVGLGYGASGAGFGASGARYGARGASELSALSGQAAQTGQQYQQMATDPSRTQDYMSPYMQNVVDMQKQEAVRDAQKQQLGASLGAARQGTYGGARQLLAQTERERNLGSQLASIQAAGSQKAFEQARQAQQYGADLGLRGLQAGISGTQAAAQTGLAGARSGIEGARTGLAGVDAGIRGAQTGMSGIDRALAGYQAGIQGVGQSLQGYQTGIQGQRVGLQGAGQAGQMGAQLGQLGSAEQAADLQRLQAQAASAGEQRALDQQRMDTAYADFLRQRDYPMEQLGFYSSILRGLPIQMGSTQTAYAQPPSTLQQLGGLGLSALGLYNLGR